MRKKFRRKRAANTPHGFFRAQYGSHRQKTERRSATGLVLILDTLRIIDGNSKHLKAAADADDRDTGFSEPAKLLGKTAPLKPVVDRQVSAWCRVK